MFGNFDDQFCQTLMILYIYRPVLDFLFMTYVPMYGSFRK